MSDSFNSPNQLSLEKSQESTPESAGSAVDAQQAVSASELEDFEDGLEDLEAIAPSSHESSFEEEVSFEIIADYIEAEVTATLPQQPLDSDENLMALEGESTEAIIKSPSDLNNANDMAELNDLDSGRETSSAKEEEMVEARTIPVVGSSDIDDVEEHSLDAADGSSEDSLDTDYISFVALNSDDLDDGVETDIESIEEGKNTDSFTTPVEIVDVEILESQEQERSYEVHQDGALTYFQYFLDEEDSAFESGYGDWRNEANSSPRSFVSATAVGVGVLAATFGAGLLMAEATNRSSISDGQKGGSATQTKADAERKASEASELAKASSPEAAVPDWSATQKAIAVSQGSAQATPSLGSAVAMLQSKTSPATSSVTSKLQPLAQSWGTSVPLPPPSLPLASRPVVTTASLPTPTTVPVDLSALKSVPSYQVIQPSSSTASSVPLPSAPAVALPQQDDQQLRARMASLRARMADPIAANAVPITTDGNLLGGPDENWVSNLPRQADVPVGENGTSLNSTFESPALPTLTDSPYGNATAASTQTVPSQNVASTNATSPKPIAAAPQAYPLDLSPVVPPHQASSLDKAVVAPVAGLLPNPVVPPQSEPLPPRASAPSFPAVESVEMTAPAPSSETTEERVTMEATPGTIALEVIPPEVSTPVLTAPVTRNVVAVEAPPMAVASTTSTQEVSTTPVAEVAMFSQGITSLTELTGSQSSQPLALSRDTARAALVNAEKLSQFRVLPLTVSEYQRLWQESGNDQTFAPVHGFVDYGQNVIAVVVTRGEVNQVSSAVEEKTNLLQRTDAPELTEVSAQPAVPAAALSQG